MAGWSLVVPREHVERVPAERVFGRASPLLDGLVLTYAAHDFTRTESVPWLMAPLGAVMVTIDIEEPVRRLLGPDAGPGMAGSPVIGMRDRPLAIEQGGVSRGIAFGLTPPGAYALFGLPLRELTGAPVSLADLLGADADRLREQLAAAAGPQARFRVLDQFLLARLARGPTMAGPVHGALQLLTASSGRLDIATVADRVGWTRQHLGVRFREQIGLTPKALARVMRLNHAVSLLSGSTPRPLAEVAQRCGYADQPHMHRDFKQLTGCTPSLMMR